MSYTLEVWSVRPVDGACLPKPGEWVPTEGGWVLGRGRGRLEVWLSAKVSPEDMPEAIAKALPGITNRTLLTVSGELTKALKSRAGRTARALASASHGIVFDPQEASLLLPPAVRRFVPARRWTLDDAAFRPDGVAGFVALLDRDRHGRGDPLGGAGTAGPMKLGFRTHHIEISFETSVLDQPGWETQLRLLWRAVSNLVRPFYGDVRTLAGYLLKHGGLWGARDTESHPVKSWWWCGVPATPASAVVIGPDYQRIWTDLVAQATVEDGLAFLNGQDWTRPASYAVPVGLIQPDPPPFDGRYPFFRPEGDRAMYAGIWPFEEPILAKLIE